MFRRNALQASEASLQGMTPLSHVHRLQRLRGFDGTMLAAEDDVSKWQDEKTERNRQSLARLTRALPRLFPSAVLSRALSRPFVPPTPRLAIDGYWRVHPLRADRLARALAARSGAPSGWTWQPPLTQITKS
jgi:hypothetical protein